MPLRSFAICLSLLVVLCAPAAAQCTIVGETEDLGPGCGVPGGPVVDVIPALNQIVINVTSAHPMTMGTLYASLGPSNPFQIPNGCTVYVDPNQMAYELVFMTDMHGDFSLAGSVPNDPSLAGLRFCVQVSLWVMGVGDLASNGDCISFVCETPGGSGCTPGYWKQPQHFDSWPSQFVPDQLFSSVFVDAFPGMTLLQVLQQGGGGLIALGRHTVAALLNTARLGGAYGTISTADVIALFNSVYPGPDSQYETLKNYFADLNMQSCSLN